MANKKYQKGARFEADIVKEWKAKGFYAKRNWGSKPFDGIIMGRGQNIMWEAKNWRNPPTEASLRKKYQWLKEMAERYGCKSVVFNKMGRGRYNYMAYWL